MKKLAYAFWESFAPENMTTVASVVFVFKDCWYELLVLRTLPIIPEKALNEGLLETLAISWLTSFQS